MPSSPEELQRYVQAAAVFTPSAPIDSQDLFAGRFEQISQVISAVSQKGQHVILYGERGVGKTSLANVISQIMRSVSGQEVHSAIVNCDGIDDFTSLWQKIFREVDSLRAHADTPPQEITPESIRYILQRNPGKTIVVIDELDRLGNGRVATELLADTIKTLSDHLVDTTLILVGVADSVNELIAEHASIERSLVQVQMPRMSVSELYELLDKRFGLLKIEVPEQIKKRIAFLSQGLPSYTHLLALHASQKAIARSSKSIEDSDLDSAIRVAVDKAYQSILNAYHQATSSSRETIYAQVLLACALAKKDNLGFFVPPDVVTPMSLIMGKKYRTSGFARHLSDFCEDKRGKVLCKRGSERNYKFRFVNPMMQPYVIMSGLAKNLISQEDLFSFSQP
ncbi:AAA family ATPase [Pseudanabaena sp. PCC 6802]|uniref:AAA family ATPase n=1 Tax=Pseudanabaena sp. PCC 6802 TaxID=118173 RepID=UPI00138B0139|nr:AAA family ATPase [Pseudanabaena sp. PCC 6802]